MIFNHQIYRDIDTLGHELNALYRKYPGLLTRLMNQVFSDYCTANNEAAYAMNRMSKAMNELSQAMATNTE